MDVSDRILVMYEGELVGQLDPKQITVEELGLYMAGAKKEAVPEEVQKIHSADIIERKVWLST